MLNLTKIFFLYICACLQALSYLPKTANASQTLSSKVLIQSVDSDPQDFQNFLKQSKDYKSLEQVGPQASSKAIEQMKALKTLADSEFTGSNLEKAYKIYLSIVGMALEQDWPLAQRQTIFISFFRMAQLKPEETNKWITKSIKFDPSLSPNKELIAQDLQNTFSKLKAELNEQMIDISPNINGDYYVNGRKSPKKIHKDELYRLTYISNIYGKKSNVLQADEINDNFPFGTPLAHGRCSQLASEENEISPALKQSFVFSAQNCKPESLSKIQRQTRLKKQRQEAQLASHLPGKKEANQIQDLELYPSSISKAQYEELTREQSPVVTTPSKTNKVKARFSKSQKTWIMIAAGALALTLGAVLNNKFNDTSSNYDSNHSQVPQSSQQPESQPQTIGF